MEWQQKLRKARRKLGVSSFKAALDAASKINHTMRSLKPRSSVSDALVTLLN